MSFRTRLTLAAALAVAVAVVLASAITFLIVRGELRGQVDSGLRTRWAQIAEHAISPSFEPGQVFLHIPAPEFGSAGGIPQVVSSQGRAYSSNGAGPSNTGVDLPVDVAARRVAAGRAKPYFRDARVGGSHMRIYTAQLVSGYALQVARPLAEVDHALKRLRFWLFFVTLGGVGVAAALGLGVTRAALAPVRRLTHTAEHVTETGDLKSRIDATGTDELSRLAASFNTMLGALEESVSSQRQLVADASHELRTPLTSLRTNIEVLQREGDSLPAEERSRILHDVVEQLSEMSVLVAELVELARGEQQAQEPEDVRLDLLVESAVERARRNAHEVRFDMSLEPSIIRGVPASIDRAVGNLLDNAAKWSPPGGTVDVSVSGGKIVVRDHGPGIDENDLPHVFDRFYRATSARGRPGSGLGLAIVKQVAEAHAGTVQAFSADGGGTAIELVLDGDGTGLELPPER
jgi:two-component system, OmpR family, sensor histidine kinase MprB